MKKTLLALLLIPTLASGAEWDETITAPLPEDTIMINDVSQPEGSKKQFTSLQRLPVSDPTKDYVDANSGVDNSKYNTLAITADHTITESEIRSNETISNFGATGEVEATLPTITYSVKRVIETEAAQALMICPPSENAIRLDGTFLGTNVCATSSATVGDLATLKHSRLADGSWYYNLVSAVGTWTEAIGGSEVYYLGTENTDGVPDGGLVWAPFGTINSDRCYTHLVESANHEACTAVSINYRRGSNMTAGEEWVSLYREGTLIGYADISGVGSVDAWTGYTNISPQSGQSLSIGTNDDIYIGVCANNPDVSGFIGFEDGGDGWNAATPISGQPPETVTWDVRSGQRFGFILECEN